MSDSLFRPLTKDDAMRPTGAETFIMPSLRMSAHERLEIYARQYWFRLLDCLHDDYPGLRALLGQTRFHRLCRAYLAECQSQSWTLRNLGCQLADFVSTHPDLCGRHHKATIDITRFEWAQVLAFDEATMKPMSVDDLLSSDAGTLILKLQPHVSLLALDFAVDDYFMAVRSSDGALRREASNAQVESREHLPSKRCPAPKKQAVWLVVHRSDNNIYFKRLEREAWLLLNSISEGKPLLVAIESALSDAAPDRDWVMQVREWFQGWAALGWFVGE